MKQNILRAIQTIPEFELVDLDISRKGEHFRQEHLKGITEKGVNKAIVVVSPRYKLVQFRELFTEALDLLPDTIEGDVSYFWGYGVTEVFPQGSKVGLQISNSVDRRGAVRVDFIAKLNGKAVLLPKNVTKPFRRVHKGKGIKVEILDYVNMVGGLENYWDSLRTSLMGTKFTVDDVEHLKESISAGEKLSEQIDKLSQNSNTLWDLFVDIIDAIERRRYKSSIHKRKKLNTVSSLILEYITTEMI